VHQSTSRIMIAIIAIVILVVAAAYALGTFSNPTPNPSPSPSSTNPTMTGSPTKAPTSTPPQQSTLPTSTPSYPPTGTTATFDFDSGTPTLTLRQGTPFSQTVNGITAQFSSPTDYIQPGFSVQSHDSLATISTVINSTRFSGNFLWPSTINHDKLDIKFSSNIVSVSLNFATAELHDPGPEGTGSAIRLSAYLDTVSTSVGTPSTANGIQPPTDIYPEGTITSSSGGQPFNLIEIDLPNPAQGASGFIIDNISIVTS
jgi:hypothetical protein